MRDPIAQRHIDAADTLVVRRAFTERPAFQVDWDSRDGRTYVGAVGECDPQRHFRTMRAAKAWGLRAYGVEPVYRRR